MLAVYNKDTLEKQVIPMQSNCILKQAFFRLSVNSSHINQVSRAQLKLVNIKGDKAILSITTTDMVNEPIVSLLWAY